MLHDSDWIQRGDAGCDECYKLWAIEKVQVESFVHGECERKNSPSWSVKSPSGAKSVEFRFQLEAI